MNKSKDLKQKTQAIYKVCFSSAIKNISILFKQKLH